MKKPAKSQLNPLSRSTLVHLDAPLLILIGDKADWMPAWRCKEIELRGETQHKFTLKVYPGA